MILQSWALPKHDIQVHLGDKLPKAAYSQPEGSGVTLFLVQMTTVSQLIME